MRTSMVPAQQVALPHAHRATTLDDAAELLTRRHLALRTEVVRVSDAAFGRDTASLWQAKFTTGFLRSLAAFFLIEDGAGDLVGWSGYRTTTIEGERVLYFTSTGLLPRAQGHGLIPALQRIVIADEARRHPDCPVTTVVRTRNPRSYVLAAKTFGDEITPRLDGTVPVERRPFVSGVATWLGLSTCDPASAVVHNAYEVDGGLYGDDPRTGDPAIDALFERLAPNDALLICGRDTAAFVRRASVGEVLAVLVDRSAGESAQTN